MCDNISQKILENENLISYTINKYFPSKKNDEDIYQVGMIALWRAIVQTEANPDSKTKFSTYAIKCIKNQIIKEIEKEQAQKRTLAEGISTIYLDKTSTSYNGDTEIYSEIIGKEEIPFGLLGIREYTSKQNKRRKKILELIEMGYSLADIAKLLNVSKTTVYNEWKSIRNDLSKIC